MKPLKTRTWIILFAVLLAGCGILTAILFFRAPKGTVANVYRNGECIYSVDLSKVEEPYEITFSDSHGSNTLRIERGCICVIASDCPDHVCEQMGWIGDGNSAPIVCLPHRLVIRIEKTVKSADDIDAVAGYRRNG